MLETEGDLLSVRLADVLEPTLIALDDRASRDVFLSLDEAPAPDESEGSIGG